MTESMRERLARLERVSELGVDVSKQLIELEAEGKRQVWQNPEPGVLTWREYTIRRGGVLFELMKGDDEHGQLSMRADYSTLVELKALAERDYAERVEMGEVEA